MSPCYFAIAHSDRTELPHAWEAGGGFKTSPSSQHQYCTWPDRDLHSYLDSISTANDQIGIWKQAAFLFTSFGAMLHLYCTTQRKMTETFAKWLLSLTFPIIIHTFVYPWYHWGKGGVESDGSCTIAVRILLGRLGIKLVFPSWLKSTLKDWLKTYLWLFCRSKELDFVLFAGRTNRNHHESLHLEYNKQGCLLV